MSFITTSLTAPPTTQVGVQQTQFSELDDLAYVIFANSLSYVARTINGRIFVRSEDGVERNYQSSSGAIRADNIYINEAAKRLFILENTLGSVYYKIVNLENNKEVLSEYLSQDTATPSLAVDLFNNRLIVYKAQPISTGVSGNYYIYAIDITTGAKTAYLDSTTAQDSTLHLFFDSTNGQMYRSLVIPGSAFFKIERLNQANPDDQVYLAAPVGGIAFTVNDINSTDLYYPVVFNNLVFVLSGDATQLSAWSTTVSNTQSILPITIDSRVDLLHGEAEKPNYPRLQIDLSTQILHDTRTFFSYNTSLLTPAVDYNICNEGVVELVFNEDFVPDSLNVRRFSENKFAFYKLANGNHIYELDSSDFCPFDETLNSIDVNFLPGVSGLQTDRINSLVGRKLSDTALTDPRVYYLNQVGGLQFYSYQDGPNTTIAMAGPGVTVALAGIENVLNHSKVRLEDGQTLYRSDSAFHHFDGVSITSYPTVVLPNGNQKYGFVFNNVYYVVHAAGVASFDLNTLTAANVAILYTSIDSVRLFVDYDGERLLLFDKRDSTRIFRLNVAPVFDFTDIPTYTEFVTEISNTVQDSVVKSTPSVNWSMYQISNSYTYYVDYDTGDFEYILNFTFVPHFGNVAVEANLEVPMVVNVSKDYVFDRNLLSQTSYRTDDFVIADLFVENSLLTGSVPLGAKDVNTFSTLSDGTIYLATVDGNNVETYEFTSIYPRLIETQPAADSFQHTWTFRLDNTIPLTFTIDEKSIEKSNYTRAQDLKVVDLTQFQSGNTFSAASLKELHYLFEVTYFLNEAELTNLMSLYEYQWYTNKEGAFAKIYFDALRNTNPDSTVSARPNLVDEYKRFVVVITQPPKWEWYHKDLYKVDFKFVEVEIANIYDGPTYTI